MQKKNFFWTLLFYFLLLTAVSPVLLREIHANDIWKALYSGRYLKLFYHFPHHSTFTYSPVKELLIRDSFNWFGNLVLLEIYNTFGLHGLQLLRITVGIVFVIMLHSFINFEKRGFYLLLLILALYGVNQKLHLRTAIFAVPFMLSLVWVLLKIQFNYHPKYLFAIPVIFLFWSNMHGSYVVGIAFLIAFFTGYLFEIFLDSNKTLLQQKFFKLLLICLFVFSIVVFVKPFPDPTAPNLFSDILLNSKTAVKGLFADQTESIASHNTNLFRSPMVYLKTKLNSFLPENKGMTATEYEFPLMNLQFLFVKSAYVLTLILVVGLLWGSLPTTMIFLLVCSAFLGFIYVRSVAYLPLIFVPVYFSALSHNLVPDFSKNPIFEYSSVILTFLIIGIFWALSLNSLSKLTGHGHHSIGFGKAVKYQSKIPKHILRNYPDTLVANSYNTGTYLIWHWWPYKKVLMDSKSSAYPPSFWRELRRNGLNQTLKNLDIDLFIVETNNKNLNKFFKESRWALKAKSGGLLLFVSKK